MPNNYPGIKLPQTLLSTMTVKNTNSFLNKEISMFPSATVSVPTGTVTIGQFLDDCKNGKYREHVERLRAETDEKKRDALKKQLTGTHNQTKNYYHGKLVLL